MKNGVLNIACRVWPVIFYLISLTACTDKEKTVHTLQDIQIIPQPQKIDLGKGNFTIDAETRIVAPTDESKRLATFLKEPMKIAAGFDLSVVEEAPSKNYIHFIRDSTLEAEHYVLTVEPGVIAVSASGYSGHLYGIQTILQLLPPQIRSKSLVESVAWTIPGVTIEDGPRFSYRGLMLDLSRHYFSPAYIKEVIDELVFHKLNKLHFHAIDDQGWRLEIKQYPKLTEIGAYRVKDINKPWNDQKVPTPEDKPTYGGYYSQEEIRDLVAYASERGVMIIPEIEMPAHVTSAVASYPFLSCTEEQVLVPNDAVKPPLLNILCAGKESTFEFVEKVLEEVMTVFPSEYIHVGGDEANKKHWEVCAHCRKRMRDEGLSDVEELESYFMSRVESIVAARGKKMIVWKERSETPGGVIPMIFKSMHGVFEATRKGYDVIAAPASHTYFDYYQGSKEQEPLAYGNYMPLSQVYRFDPMIDSMSVEQKRHVLGGQANLWSEFVQTESTSEYMLYPRLAALSESVWTNAESRTWEDFSRRVQLQFQRYEYAGLNYARSAYNVDYTIKADKNSEQVVLKLQTEFPNVEIRYTIDPQKEASVFRDSIILTTSANISAKTYQGGQPVGKELVLDIDFDELFINERPVRSHR